MTKRQHNQQLTGGWGGRGLAVLSLSAAISCGTTEDGRPASGTASGGTSAGASGGIGSNNASGSGGESGTGGAVLGSGGVGEGEEGTGGVATGGLSGDATGGSASGGVQGVDDVVTRTASTFTFHHFPIQANDSDVWNGPTSPTEAATSTTFDTVVLENGYLRVTLLPDYGGRILSIIHKPTNRELLYQNPIGTPYLMGEDIFYYDYLVIMGGIFPSFPEPEHGRYWNQPYELEVVSESNESVTVRMSRKDDIDPADGVPERYVVGRTDVLVELEVTLRAGSSRVDLNTKLTNTKTTPVPEFEYWTVTTLAPGSTPGQTSIPLNTRILAEMDQVHLLESSWAWFADAEERVSGEVFKWKNLSQFTNWVEQGTAFANPDYRANWSGLINDDEDMAILRVSDSAKTPGLKLWTFGKESLNIDVNDSAEWLRPTIEMWHGITPEFWNRAAMAAGEIRQWSDHYFPTMGLNEITAASEFGALSLSAAPIGSGTTLSATATLTLPDQTVHAVLRLDGSIIAEQDVVVESSKATTVSATVADAASAPGAVFEVEFLQGASSLIVGQMALP